MPKIAYILLCHKAPDVIIQQAELLTAADDYVAIHFDMRASNKDFAQIQNALKDNPNVVFSDRRIKCGWGEWSLVEATLLTVEAALKAFEDATHFYMISGDCSVIKSAKYAHDYLARENADYIESFDFFKSEWIKTGIKEERLIYRHWFNERTQPNLYYWSLSLQQRLGLKREIPKDLNMRIGSQWWCLRRKTIELLFTYLKAHPEIIKFFRTTWIPDETFFQTMVAHLVPDEEIRKQTLTFLMFSDYGLPVVFYNDHYDYLLSQSHLFARKISPEAKELRQRFSELYLDSKKEFKISDNGRKLFEFLSQQGRYGRRFAGRFWETESSLGWDRELMIIVCKKWHVAKRLIAAIRAAKYETPSLEYIFNEVDAGLPNLGGIEQSVSKSTRHRRSLMRMLYDYYDTNRVIICMDPSNLDILKDFLADRAQLRVLQVNCEFTDEYLRGHLKRLELASDWTPEEVIKRLIPTVRKELHFERDQIRETNFKAHWAINEANTPEFNATQISMFLDAPPEVALKIARTPHLFDD